jgi:hypothetical protein
MQNGCPAGSANTYRGSSWSSVRSSSSVAPRASALSRWICKSSRVATTVSRWSICGTAASGHVEGRTPSVCWNASCGPPCVFRNTSQSLPAGQAGWAPAAQRRRGTPARTAGSGGSAHSRIGATLMRPNRIGLPRQAVAGAGGHPRSLLAVAGDGVGMRGHQPRGPLRVTALEPEYARDKPSRPADKDQLRRTHLCPTPGKEQDHDRTSTLRLVHRR